MGHIDGNISNIDLEDLHSSDYFKIGVAHAEQGIPQDPAYTNQQAYLDGYAQGLTTRPYLFPEYSSRSISLTYSLMKTNYASYQVLLGSFQHYSDLLMPR